MNRKVEILVVVTVALAAAVILSSSPLTASDFTIIGEINDSNQIVADEMIFEVDDTPEGDNLVKNYKNKKVKVTGKLTIEGDMRIIAVKEFEVVEE